MTGFLVFVGVGFVIFAVSKFVQSLWSNDLSKHSSAPPDYSGGKGGGIE